MSKGIFGLKAVWGNGYTFRGDTPVIFFFVSSVKGIYSERKEFAPAMNYFFPFMVDPFF